MKTGIGMLTVALWAMTGCANAVGSASEPAGPSAAAPLRTESVTAASASKVAPYCYCRPWEDSVTETCTTLPADPAAAFTVAPRTACRNTDGTVWTTYGPEGYFMRYRPTAPDSWEKAEGLCMVDPDGTITSQVLGVWCFGN